MPPDVHQANRPVSVRQDRSAAAFVGSDTFYRKLWEPERPALLAHFLRLAPADRRLRFCHQADDAEIHTYCARVRWSGATIIGGFVGGALRGVVELIFDPGRLPRDGEVALSVEGPYQDTGIGTELLRMALTAARNRHVRTVHLACLYENTRMQRLARKFDAVLTIDAGAVEGRIIHPWPSYRSLLEEATADGRALLRASFGVG